MRHFVPTPQYVRGCVIDYAEDGSIDDIRCESISEWAAHGYEDYLEEWNRLGLSDRVIKDLIEEDVRSSLEREAPRGGR